MSYKWRIKWKDFNEQELIISEAQGKFLNEKLIQDEKERGDRFVINGIPYLYSSINNVEPTTQKEDSDIKSLMAGTGAELTSGPLIDNEGFVVTNWVKKLVSSKEYEGYYARHPSYYSLDRTDNGGIYIAFRRVEQINSERPSDVELCTEQEAERLWKYSTAV